MTLLLRLRPFAAPGIRLPAPPALSACALALLLAACGGGGGSGGGIGGSIAPTEPDVRTLSALPLEEQAALDRLNEIRTAAGVPALSRNGALDTAARTHSFYTQTNSFSHVETPGLEYFRGQTVGDRVTAAGYPWLSAGEVLARSQAESGPEAVDELIAAIYHRFAMLSGSVSEAGSGVVRTSRPTDFPGTDLTMNFAMRAAAPPGTPAQAIVLYPAAGQTDVPIDFLSDTELPDPVPGQDRVGYPVSAQLPNGGTLSVTSFTIAPAGGTPLTTRLLDATTDATNLSGAAYLAAIVPLAPLQPATTYQVQLAGRANNVPFTRSWQFTTRSVSPLTVSTDRGSVSSTTTALITIGGGINPRLASHSFTNATGLPLPVKIERPTKRTLRVTGNGYCPSVCSVTLNFSDSDGTTRGTTLQVTR